MAPKPATVYIIDVGATMKQHGQGRDMSNFDWAMQYVIDGMINTIVGNRSTEITGVIALRSPQTNHDLGEDPHYSHISVLQPLDHPTLANGRDLLQLQPGDELTGDAISAIVVAISMIEQKCRKLQYTRKIVLLTDAKAPVSEEGLADIISKIKSSSIQLVVLGVDFDQAGDGFKEAGKDPTKAHNEAVFQGICSDCNGLFASLTEAIEELAIPRVHEPAVRGSKIVLSLGDATSYENSLSIEVVRSNKIVITRPRTASSYVEKSDMIPTHTVRNYTVDAGLPDGRQDVTQDEIVKGYLYGRTATYMSESDRAVTDFHSDCQQDLTIMGFVDAAKYDPHVVMDRPSLITGNVLFPKSCMALLSLVEAMRSLEQYAVARFVKKAGADPQIVLLIPDNGCFVQVDVPFAEDTRQWRFPAIDHLETLNGEEITKHRDLPTEQLHDAMSKYVDSMALSDEQFSLEDNFNQVVQYLDTSIGRRGLGLDQQPPAPIPEQTVVEKSVVDDLVRIADLKQTPPKNVTKTRREEIRPISGLDVTVLLRPRNQSRKLDRQNAIPMFKQIIGDTSKQTDVQALVDQLGAIINDWIQNSIGDSSYAQAIAAITVMRDEIAGLEMPAIFNNFLRSLKQKLIELGDREEMWYKIRLEKLGLITEDQDAASDVTAEDAAAFLAPRLA